MTAILLAITTLLVAYQNDLQLAPNVVIISAPDAILN
jgi:hypothetical protein